MRIVVAADLLAFLIVVVALRDGGVDVGLPVADGSAGVCAGCPVFEGVGGDCGGREGEESKDLLGVRDVILKYETASMAYLEHHLDGGGLR